MIRKADEKVAPFIRYPTNKLFAVVNDPHDVQAVLDALSDLGLASEAVETFCGEEGIKRIDARGHEHNLLTRIIRTVQQLGQEGEDVRRYEQELRAGHYLISVLVSDPDEKTKAANAMKAHGGSQINFYGPISTEML